MKFQIIFFLWCVEKLLGQTENQPLVAGGDPTNKKLSTEITDLKSEIIFLKSKGARSCHELKAMTGIDKSGHFLIDPAKTGSPIKVYCDMVSEETWIGHDGEELAGIAYCEGSGCFVKKYEYEASNEQIEALKDISETCYQELTFECNMAPLIFVFRGVTSYSGWWTGLDGTKKTYFDGNDEESHVCGCHATNSCQHAGACNCANLRGSGQISDKGKLTDKTSLPVRSFVYGDFWFDQAQGKIMVGKFKCTAGSYTPVMDWEKEILDMKAEIKEISERNDKAVTDNEKEHKDMILDMKAEIKDISERNDKAVTDNEKEHKDMNEKYVFTCGYRDSVTSHGATITYDKITINEKGKLVGAGELNTGSGVYTAPLAGIYTFTWSVSAYNQIRYSTDIFLRINGNTIGESRHYSYARGAKGASHDQGGRTMIFRMQKGDTADLYCYDCRETVNYITFCVTLSHGDT